MGEADLETLLPLEAEEGKPRASRLRLAAALAGTCAVGLLGAAAVLPKGAKPAFSKMDASIAYYESLESAADAHKDHIGGVPIYHEQPTPEEKEFSLVFKDLSDDDFNAIKDSLGDAVIWSGTSMHICIVKGAYDDLKSILEDHLTEDQIKEIGLMEQDTKLDAIPDRHDLVTDRRLSAASWGIDRTDQRSLPLNDHFGAVGHGRGAHVYIFDTGVLCSHNDFAGRCKPTLEIVGNGPVVCDSADMTCATDRQGHGTHCAGSAAGTSYGIASKATIHSVKILSDNGGGSFNWFNEAIDWTISNGESPAVISASLGGKGTVRSTEYAINTAVGKGVTVVVAAGNENDDACGYSPAYISAAITVGSTDSADKRSGFSNYGNCLDIFAPGSNIMSAGHSGDDAKTGMSGTSMACPHVAGAAAVFLAADSSLKPSCSRSGSDCAGHVSSISQPLVDHMKAQSSLDVVHNKMAGSPDKLLYVGDGNPPATTVPPPPPSAAHCRELGWKVTSGDCQIDSDCCLSSPGDPTYDDNQKCDIVVGSNPGVLKPERFNTEAGYDFLTMTIADGTSHKFSGRDGPNNLIPAAEKTMTWTSDYSEVSAGFKVCMQIDVEHLCPANGWKKAATCLPKFTYRGTEYDGCATVDHHGGWCATKINGANLYYADCEQCGR